MTETFEIRNTDLDDYEQLCEWWKWWRFPAPPLHILPDNKQSGIMVSYGGENLCAGFIYATSSASLYWLEWVISSPKIKDKEVRKQGLKLLIDGLTHLCQEVGAKCVYTSLVNPKLVEAYIDCGFVKGSSGAIEMTKSF